MGLMVCLPPPSTPRRRLIRHAAALCHAACLYFRPLSYLLLIVCTYVFCEFQISRQGARRQAKQCSDSWLFPPASCQLKVETRISQKEDKVSTKGEFYYVNYYLLHTTVWTTFDSESSYILHKIPSTYSNPVEFLVFQRRFCQSIMVRFNKFLCGKIVI